MTAVGISLALFSIAGESLRVLVEPEEAGWRLPGDSLQKGETPAAAATRILRGHFGPRTPYHEQLYTFGDESPRITVAYFAVVPARRIPAGPEFRPANRELALRATQQAILDEAIERLRTKAEYSTVPLRFLEEPFTLSEVQAIYEVLLERALDKRNFRRKMLALEAIEQVEGKRRGGAHRPARLFRLSPERPYLLKERGILFPF
ncbi:MAG: NUDIX hydrolase [Planctomycetes bacterium]|nr:NUDIX hydrolase [Planctomycetota bacterium]